MGSLAFKEWAASEGHIKSSPLEQLKGSRVAIDAEDFLNALLSTSPTREPLLPALGGLPFALEHHVDYHLQSFQNADITPIFVFNGLELACRDRKTIARENIKVSRSLEEAWSLYNQTRAQEAVEEFGKTCTYRTYHILRWLQVLLHGRNIRFQVAPYSAAPQILGLEAGKFADAAVGSASLLVFGADRVITDFDWAANAFSWISRDDLLSKLRLSQDQFIDLCLLSGYVLLPPVTDLDGEVSSRVSVTLTLLRRMNWDITAVAMQAKDDDYLTIYRKARAAVRHCAVITKQGKVEASNQPLLPGDGHEILGQQLPPELVGYLSRGVVGPQLLNSRARSEIYETPPLDGGNTATYKDVVQTKLAPIRARALAVLTQLLHRYYQKNDVELVCWFNETRKKKLGVPDLAEATKAADTWNVRDSAFAVRTQLDVQKLPLSYALDLLSDESFAKQTVTPRSATEPIKEAKELTVNALWRFLHDRGYIENDHTLSARGKALNAALLHLRRENDDVDVFEEAEDALLTIFELARLDLLTDEDFFYPHYSGAPSRGTNTDKRRTLLISRIACLCNLQHKKIGYTGPLSRHLLAYHQVVAAVRGSVRDLLEAHAAHMLQSGAVDRSLSLVQQSDLAFSLPLINEPNLGLGLVVKSYLDELSNDAAKRANILEWFPQVLDFQGNLDKIWKLWGAVNTGVQAAETSVFNTATKKLFRETDEWLQQKLQNAPTINGTG